jgi:hypothetical protein
MRVRDTPVVSLGREVGSRDWVRGEWGSSELVVPFEMEIEGRSRAPCRARTESWGLDFGLVPLELPGRESGGELEKSRTRLSPEVVALSCLLLSDGNEVFLSSVTGCALSKGVRPAGGVQSPPPTEAGVEAPDNAGRDS